MGLRTALRQSKVVTFAVLAALAWTFLTGLHVLRAMTGVLSVGADSFVGQTAAGGILGALVLAALAGLLVYLLAEVGETAPAPEPWPPNAE